MVWGGLSSGRPGLLAWLGLAGCADTGTEAPVTANPGLAEPTGLVLFTLEMVAGERTGLPSRSQVTVVEYAQAKPDGTGGRILRTLAGPGRLSGHDTQVPGVSMCKAYALPLPARPLSMGRVFVEPRDVVTRRTNYLLPTLLFTPRPGRALYLGNLAILPHSWEPSRETHIQPSSHRALRDMWGRDEALFRAVGRGLEGLPVDRLERPLGWPQELPPRDLWPAVGGRNAVGGRSGPAPAASAGTPSALVGGRQSKPAAGLQRAGHDAGAVWRGGHPVAAVNTMLTH